MASEPTESNVAGGFLLEVLESDGSHCSLDQTAACSSGCLVTVQIAQESRAGQKVRWADTMSSSEVSSEQHEDQVVVLIEDDGRGLLGSSASGTGLQPMWSTGAAGHEEGSCKPCAHFYKPASCRFGADCTFCHLCPWGAALRLHAQKRRQGKQSGARRQRNEQSRR
mmetsp:Transcript_24569/g.57068  ORF Transcript_24569/g.57068 Transcript_24569/m.57068 type:complete len:167 (-) Transcript_24569:58-558(-)